MEQKLVRKILQVDGMTCASCEMRIERALGKIPGVMEVKAIYSSSNVYVTYEEGIVELEALIDAIEKLDYKVKNKPVNQVNTDVRQRSQGQNESMPINQLIGIGVILLALYVIIKNTVGFNFIPQVNQSMGYGILFLVGLLTSLHCIAMCGGINLSVCASYRLGTDETGRFSKLKPSLMYNAGRVASYTVIGGIVGALGSVVSFSGSAKGVVAIISGIFMVIMGLNMLNIFPWLRKFNPRMPKLFGNKVYNGIGKRGPFFVGLLNGLMPCGPLQAMQLYALGTGSFFAGALSMFLFSMGTVPLMFGFGAVSSLLSGKFTHKMMKISAVLVMVLGIVMMSRGLALAGVNVALAAPLSSGSIAKIEGNVQVVTTKLESGNYTPIVVQKGIPVKWTITATAEDLNGCNNPVTIPKYNIEKKLVPGDNVIEFTPEEEGNIAYTCWMGMISSNIKVVSDINNVTDEDIKQSASSANSGALGGGGCCAAGSKATKFANGKIPTDNIKIAEVKNGSQEVTITVNDEGYSPAVVVVQRGVNTKIKFNPEKLNSCNNSVIFPEYQGQLNLENGELETPELVPDQDFTFQCWMGMLHGYVKVVDDVKNVNIDDIRNEIDNYTPAAGSSGGGCCGG